MTDEELYFSQEPDTGASDVPESTEDSSALAASPTQLPTVSGAESAKELQTTPEGQAKYPLIIAGPSAGASEIVVQAYQMAAAGERTAASRLVVQALKQDGNDVDALWLYANLKRDSDPEKAAGALDRLLAVQPNHRGAHALLDELRPGDDDLDFSKPQPAPVAQPTTAASVPEHINITVNPQVNVTSEARAAAGPPMMMEDRNGIAYAVGLLVGILFATFGFAHYLNGKIISGLVVMLLGWFIWIPIAAVLISLTGGLGACIVLPIHIGLAHSTARSGARVDRAVYYR